MPQTATDYPIGAKALFGGTLVTVHQHIDAETILIMGPKVCRRVRARELSPPPEKSLFDQWRDERIIKAYLGDVFTPASEVAADYRRWLDQHGHAETYPVTDRAFMGLMQRAGHKATRGYWRAPGERSARTRVLFPFSLMPVLQ